MKEPTKITKKYLVKEITKDGLVKDPKDTWDYLKYTGYDTEEEAVAAILKAEDFGACFVLPVYSTTIDWDAPTPAT